MLKDKWLVYTPAKICEKPTCLGMYEGDIENIAVHLANRGNTILLFVESLLDGETISKREDFSGNIILRVERDNGETLSKNYFPTKLEPSNVKVFSEHGIFQNMIMLNF